jgi:hypothetical protein
MFPDLLEGLTRQHRCDPALCFPTDATRLVWQLRTPSGVRLLSLETDDLGDPRACVLRSALVGYWWARGVTLRIELPPATRDDDGLTRALERRARPGVELNAWTNSGTRSLPR